MTKMCRIYFFRHLYTVIGSILDGLSARSAIVWGSGFMHSNGKIVRPPKKICAVRGPLSRKLFLKMGIKCPDVYGDPAILMPLLYNPDVKKQFTLGIIPHIVDQNNESIKYLKKNDSIKIINIKQGVHQFIDDVNKCEFIASSSLHGLIIADAYNIPSVWVKFSDKISGNDFKYYDYYLSIRVTTEGPLYVNSTTTEKAVLNKADNKKLNLNIKQLLEVCPFNSIS